MWKNINEYRLAILVSCRHFTMENMYLVFIFLSSIACGRGDTGSKVSSSSPPSYEPSSTSGPAVYTDILTGITTMEGSVITEWESTTGTLDITTIKTMAPEFTTAKRYVTTKASSTKPTPAPPSSFNKLNVTIDRRVCILEELIATIYIYDTKTKERSSFEITEAEVEYSRSRCGNMTMGDPSILAAVWNTRIGVKNLMIQNFAYEDLDDYYYLKSVNLTLTNNTHTGREPVTQSYNITIGDKNTFATPSGASFLCNYTKNITQDDGKGKKVTVSVSYIRLQAFEVKDGVFSKKTTECTDGSMEVILLVVGVNLSMAALLVSVGCIIRRRRKNSRRMGYQLMDTTHARDDDDDGSSLMNPGFSYPDGPTTF